MKYLERLLRAGWHVDIIGSAGDGFYIDAIKESTRRMGYSKESLSKALENLLEVMKGDGVI